MRLANNWNLEGHRAVDDCDVMIHSIVCGTALRYSETHPQNWIMAALDEILAQFQNPKWHSQCLPGEGPHLQH